MAAKHSSASSSSSKRKAKKKRVEQEQELERFDSLPWNASLGKGDPFSIFAGSSELDGGFLSLEEIDESGYGLGIPELERGVEKLSNSKKRTRSNRDDEDGGEDNGGVGEVESQVEEEQKGVKRKIKKKKKKNAEAKDADNNSKAMEVSNGKDVVEITPVDEAEFYAWNELRLHDMLMKSIYRLGFKEPTPIQAACIPAAAHQGKDVIGAAETGSGKTLAFGIPILQRLLEEREKMTKLLAENGEEEAEEYAREGVLRALIITPTRELALQVTDHLKQAAMDANIRVVPIVGGMSTEKQERLLRARPEIVVATPGRLWELMSGGDTHLVELHSLSFFVLDEADRMVESGHFQELQSIIEMLPTTSGSTGAADQNSQSCVTVGNFQRKKRQTFVFSATIALSSDFRKKLKRGSMGSKKLTNGLNSIEILSERAGIRPNAAIIDLTSTSILAKKLEESFIECREEDKDAYLYYILSVHGQGRTIVFCTSIDALQRISSILSILKIKASPLHAKMQQRARLKAMDRFRGDDRGILVATDVAARGLDILGVRTVVHYQLPHNAETYVHRSGRTARGSADGCSIALISPNDKSDFASLCKSFSKESFRQFPLDLSYMQEVNKRLSLARQVDKISHQGSKEKAKKTWFRKNAEAIGLDIEDNESEDERANNYKQKKANSMHLMKLKQELNALLSRPLRPATLRPNYLTGAGVSPLLQNQFEELARDSSDNITSRENKGRNLMVIGKDNEDTIHALRSAGHEVNLNVKENAEKRRNMEALRRKRKDEKKYLRDQRRKQKKRMKGKD